MCFIDEIEDMMAWSEIGGGQPGAIDSSLVALDHEFKLDSACSCQKPQHGPQVSFQASQFGVNKDFHPVEALDFVLKIAVSPSFDPEADSHSLRAVAQLYAFRCYTCMESNWIYQQTMRIPKTRTISFCLEDEGKCSVAAEVDCVQQELVEQEKCGSVIHNKNSKVALEPDYLKVFQPFTALNFIQRMAVSPSVDEIEFVDAVSTVAQVYAFRRYVCLKDGWIYRQTMRLSESTHEAEADINSSFSEDEQTCSLAQEEKISDEDKENSEKVDCIHEEFVEQVKSGSVMSEKNHMVALEHNSMKLFQPVKVLTFIRRMAVSPLVDGLDVVDAIPTVAQVYAFRRYVFLEHDWIYRETMRLSGSTDESEADIDCRFSEDEHACSGVQEEEEFADEAEVNIDCRLSKDEQACSGVQEEEEFSDEDRENSGGSSVTGFTRDIPNSIGEVDSSKRQKPWDVTLCSTSTLERDDDFLEDFPKSNCPSNLKRHNTKGVRACINRNEDVVGPVCRDVHLPRYNADSNSGLYSSKRRKREAVEICSKIRYMENVVEPVCRDVCLPRYCADSSSTPASSKKRKSENVKICSKLRDMESVVAPVGSDVDPQRLDTDCNGETEPNKRQKKDIEVCCSIGNTEDAIDSGSGDVDIVTVPADCNNVSENSDRQNVDVHCNTRSAEGKDMADTIREILECEKKSHSSQRQETEKNICSRSNVESRDVTDFTRYVGMRKKTKDVTVSYNINDVDGSNTDTLRETRCNRESNSNKRLKTCTCDSLFHFQGGSIRTFHEGSSASAARDQYSSKAASHVLNDHSNFKLCNEASIDNEVGPTTGKRSPKEIIAPISEDRDGVLPSQSPVSHLSHDSIDLHSSAGAATDISGNVRPKSKVDQSSCKGNGRLKTPGAVLSRMFRQSKSLSSPLNMFYYSPLRKDSPTKRCIGESKSSKTHAQTQQPRTLNMKFSKDCVPPSKEELVKQFRRFGPLDYLQTKVYFYTGSAEVVFLDHSDAKAAYNYARRKSIFPGGDKARYWLYDHELSRTNHISTSISSPTGSSVPILKSCLRVPGSLGSKIRRTDLHVKFQSTC